MRQREASVVLFDLDGTLTDAKEGIIKSILFALEKVGRPYPHPEPGRLEELRGYVGPPLLESFKKILGPSHEALAETALGFYRERYGRIGMFENTLYSGIPGVLASLQRQGKRLFVATSKPRVFADKIVAHFALDPFFEAVYGSELSYDRSDKGELIAHLLAKEGILAEAAIMVGDRKFDVIGAKKNGMRSVGVGWGYGSREELMEAGALAVASKPEELVGLIRGDI